VPQPTPVDVAIRSSATSEEQGVVTLVQTRTADPMAEILREGVTHVEVRVPV
jgi:hypothetical protein